MSSRQRPRLPQHHRAPASDPASASGDGQEPEERSGTARDSAPAAETAPGADRPTSASVAESSSEAGAFGRSSGRGSSGVRVNDPSKVAPYEEGSGPLPLAEEEKAAAETPEASEPDARPDASQSREGHTVSASAEHDLDDPDAAPRAGGLFGGRLRARRRRRPAPEAPEHPSNVVAFSEHHQQRRRASGRRRLRNWGLGLGALVLVVALFLGIVFFSPLLAVRTITVEGTKLTDKAAIQKSLSGLDGVPLTRISEQDVKDRIGSDVKIRDVTMEARPPHQLVVKVQERVPVATVKDGSSYLLVDSDGVTVGSAKSQSAAGVPLVDGGKKAVGSSGFSSLVKVLQTVPQSLLSQMDHAEASSPADITLHLDSGITVKWGTSDQSEYKAQVLASLVKALGENTEYSTIDVSSPDHPVTK